MPSRPQLKWNVPAGPWEVHERAVLEEHGYKDLYAGVEAERIVRLWFRFEEDGASPRPGHAGTPPHTQKTNGSSVPLEDQEKIIVGVRFHPGLKERLTDVADQYDVYPGVMLAYILREYYETDGWGYAPEAVGSDLTSTADTEPSSRRERLTVICDRLYTAENGELLAEDIREVIADVAGPTVVDGPNGYLSDVLDRIGYVHHPHVDHIYIAEEVRADQYGVSPDDPAIDRKPFSQLSRAEKIEGIEDYVSRSRRGFAVSKVHAEIFDGEGSTTHVRDLVHTVAEKDGFKYSTTISGSKKVLKGSRPSESEEQEDEDKTDDETRPELEDEADAQMDALMNAKSARTDGGQDEPEQ